ncbi:MAG: PAS domain-containing protein [Myxococcales bacterium]|nr:PAS domain-containing protein [Myxococcales bacterium]
MADISRLTKIIDSVPAYVAYVTLADLRYRFVNQRFEEAYKLPRASIIGRHIRDVIGEANYAFAQPYIEEVRQGRNASYVNRFEIAQGSRWLRVNYIPDHDGGPEVVGIIVLTYDISEQKQIEEALVQSQETYRSTIDAFEDSLIAVDREMTIVLANQAFLRNQARRDLDVDVIGRKLTEALPYIPEASLAEYPQIFADGKPITTEHEYRIAGRDLCAETRKIPVMEGGEVVRVVTIVRDLTDKRRMERELNRAQRLESLGQLAGGIAHDFNNILTALFGNVQLARLAAEPGSPQWQYLRDSELACQQAEKLTRQLLTFAKGGEPMKKVVDLSSLVDHAARFSLRGSNVDYQLRLPDDLWHVEADEGQLGQVFNNLVINANQAMPEGGNILIEGANLTLSAEQAKVIACEPGRYVRISVEDRGEGIDVDHLAKIFDPFFSTKTTGSGLGLTTCYSIVRRHGGQIDVRSELGRGSTFRVYLPASDETAAAAPSTTAPSRGGGRLLFMDDDRTVRDTAARMLRVLGYQVDFAQHGEEALTMYARAKRGGERYDGVILDLTISGGMGGKECMARLLATDPDARVVISSGYSNDPIMADYQRFGAAAVIPKPFSLEALGETLGRVLDGR